MKTCLLQSNLGAMAEEKQEVQCATCLPVPPPNFKINLQSQRKPESLFIEQQQQ